MRSDSNSATIASTLNSSRPTGSVGSWAEPYRAGEHTVSELEELFPLTRSAIYRAVARAGTYLARASRRNGEVAASLRLSLGETTRPLSFYPDAQASVGFPAQRLRHLDQPDGIGIL
jgi:hypothetical protein